MKNILTVLMMVFAFSLAAPDVHAKKFGGSKSFGKSYKTAPQKQTNAANPAKQTSNKKGLMGGLLGGLLAGGLIAALFGGAFEGFQFLDMILIAGLAFVLLRLFRNMNQAKALSQQGGLQQQPVAQTAQGSAFRQDSGADTAFTASQGGFATPVNDVPFKLPADFDLINFLEGARGHYKTLQQAWNKNDLETIQEYVSIELYNELQQQRKELVGQQHTEVMFLDAELVRADSTSALAQVSVKFAGRYRDSHEDVEADINEVWHLERQLSQANAPWLIVGIEQ